VVGRDRGAGGAQAQLLVQRRRHGRQQT
jgi:hypothetical protein